MSTEKKMVLRYAPSPTGPQHIGGVRTALYNYLFAKKHNAEFILRIEDTDQERFVPGAEEYIIEAMNWVGIQFTQGPHIGGPHAPYRQSERKPIYRQYADQLLASGWAYIAFDTPEELDQMRERMTAAGLQSPQYNFITRTQMKNSLTLTPEEVQTRIANGDPYVVRFKMPRKEDIRFQDEIRGWVVVHSGNLDDKVLLKSDGMPTYHLANIVDDHLMEVTHVIRGEEWLPSAPLHVMLYRAFGWEAPKFAHLPLLLKPDGNGKLSKRDGDRLGFPVFPMDWTDPFTGEKSTGYRQSGYIPEALLNFLALLGWNPGGDRELMSVEEMIQLFTLDRISKSGAKFDYHKALWFNQTYLRNTPETDLISGFRQEIESRGWPAKPDTFLAEVIRLLKERATFSRDFAEMSAYFFEAPTTYDEAFKAKQWAEEKRPLVEACMMALESLETWTAAEIEGAVKAKAAEMGVNPGKLMPVFRLLITGVGTGPGTFDVASLIGKAETISRIRTGLQKM